MPLSATLLESQQFIFYQRNKTLDVIHANVWDVHLQSVVILFLCADSLNLQLCEGRRKSSALRLV